MGENMYIQDLVDFDVTILLYQIWFMKYSAYVRRIVADFSHAPPNEYSPSPNDKKQEYLVWFDFYKFPLCTGCWFGKEACSPENFDNPKELEEESFARHCCYELRGNRIQVLCHIQWFVAQAVFLQVKTMKIQAGIQVSRPREPQKDNSALEALWKTLFNLPPVYLYSMRISHSAVFLTMGLVTDQKSAEGISNEQCHWYRLVVGHGRMTHYIDLDVRHLQSVLGLHEASPDLLIVSKE
ncbi:hypothetical protein Tco_0054557 [Tanacetum coccineum]